MNYYLTMALIFIGLFLLYFGFDIYNTIQRKKLLKKLASTPFSDKYRKYLFKIPHYKLLNKQDKEKIERSILIFIHTKEFIGVKLNITDEMKIVIAFYACLLILHMKTDYLFDEVKTIVIYPHPIIINDIKSYGGIYTKAKYVIQGQSTVNAVVLSWHEAKAQAYHLRHNNVIIHEFTHELDFSSGSIDGAPILEQSKYHEWCDVLFKEYRKLNSIAIKNRNWGKYKLLGNYAATNEAEFFAVITERYFESPHSLKQNFPELFEELNSFYKLDFSNKI